VIRPEISRLAEKRGVQVLRWTNHAEPLNVTLRPTSVVCSSWFCQYNFRSLAVQKIMGRASRNSGVSCLPGGIDRRGMDRSHRVHPINSTAMLLTRAMVTTIGPRRVEQDMRSKESPLPRHSAQNAILCRWAESGHAGSECRYPI
jgi:hypothetical protein